MPDNAYNRFVDAWNSGDRPDVDDFAARVPEAQRAEFLQMVSLFLEQAPPPPLSDEQRDALRAHAGVRDAVKLGGTQAGLWSTLLPRLRTKLRLTREQVVAQLAAQLGVQSEEQRVKVYYHQMETDQLDPSGVSRRVLDALAGLLHTDVNDLEQAGSFRGIVGSEPEVLYLRSEGVSVEDVTTTVGQAPSTNDEVDRLFTGGR